MCLLPSWQGRASSIVPPSSSSATMSPDPPQEQPSRSCVSDAVPLLKVKRSLQWVSHVRNVNFPHFSSGKSCVVHLSVQTEKKNVNPFKSKTLALVKEIRRCNILLFKRNGGRRPLCWTAPTFVVAPEQDLNLSQNGSGRLSEKQIKN